MQASLYCALYHEAKEELKRRTVKRRQAALHSPTWNLAHYDVLASLLPIAATNCLCAAQAPPQDRELHV